MILCSASEHAAWTIPAKHLPIGDKKWGARGNEAIVVECKPWGDLNKNVGQKGDLSQEEDRKDQQ